MSMRQRLTTDGDGRAVLVKQATSSDVDRLAEELAVLRAASHPGVVEVLEDRPGGEGGFEVVLAVAGSRTAADVQTDLRGAAGLVAALATTVADLHQLGIVHGRIRAEHVVVDGSGRPVLCGFSGAGSAGSTPELTPATDVAGLGRLLRQLVPDDAGDTGDWEPIPRRRFARRDRWAGYVRRSLLTLADQATAEDPSLRPPARSLAASILAALPEARLPSAPSDAAAMPVPGSRPMPRLAPVMGALGLGLLVFGMGGLLRPSSSPRAVPAAGVPTSSPRLVPAAAAPTTISPRPAAPSSPSTTTTEATAPARAVEVGGGVVTFDGVRYAVGQPGDLVAIGDWDCDGTQTVALVRRGTGEVFLFDRWAAPGDDLVATATATVEGATAALGADPDGDGCPVLVVTGEGGTRREVTA